MQIKTILLLLLIFALAIFLRTYKISTIPPGLYVDEASVAYNAYQILTTGKDEHGVTYPFAFQAFGEYKMPVFIYMTSASLALFGKNEFAIRIPSAFFGSLTVIVFYFLAKELIYYEKKLNKKQKDIFAYMSTLLFAISPWHIQFSRAGFEAIIALFFFLLGFLFFLFYKRKNHVLLLLGAVFFMVLSMYSYNAFRVIGVVGTGAVLAILFVTKPKKYKHVIVASICALLFALPMLLFSFTHAGQARFMQVTAFSKDLHLSILAYLLLYINNYLSYFSLPFLFSFGDTIGRHTVFRMGPLFKWEIIFLVAGIYFLIREKINVFTEWILFLLFVAPLAASLAVPSPHLLRSILLVIPITLIVGYGIIGMWIKMKNKKFLFFGIIFFVAIFEFFLYLDLYYNYTTVTIPDWGGQYKELLATLQKDAKPGTVIIFNNNVGMSYVYQKFYYPKMNILYVDDSWTKPKSFIGKNILYVTTAEQKQKNTYIHTYPHTKVDTITTPDKYRTALYNIWKI